MSRVFPGRVRAHCLPVGALLLAACASTPRASEHGLHRDETPQLAALPGYRGIADCTGATPADTPCREMQAPTLGDAERALGARPAAAWGRGGRWTVAYRAADDAVTGVDVMGGVQLPLSRIPGSRVWALALRLPGLDSAVISLALDVRGGAGGSVYDTTSLRVWRGPSAPPPPRERARVAGSVREDSLWSDALRAWRRVTVYLPPGVRSDGGPGRTPVVYVADGQNVRDYARVVDPLVAAGALPPVALVGVWVSSGTPGGGPPTGPATDLRTIEYHPEVERLPGADSAFVAARYRGHYRFFTDEVPRWAEATLGVSAERRWRAVQGNSSGASYALRLGRELPERYGLVIANSNGARSDLAGPAGGWGVAPWHYLSVGVLEPALARTLRAMGDSLARHGVRHAVTVYPSGHDAVVWRESLPRALAWWLAPSGTP